MRNSSRSASVLVVIWSSRAGKASMSDLDIGVLFLHRALAFGYADQHAGGNDFIHFGAGKVFFFDQAHGKVVQVLYIVLKQGQGTGIAAVNKHSDLAVDLHRRGFTKVLVGGHFASQEDLLILLPEGERTQFVAHTPL